MSRWYAPRVSAVRVAFAASTVAALAIVAACSEGGVAKSVAGPSAPTSVSKITGIESAGLATVCVSGPTGTYTLQNSNFVEGADGTTIRYDNGTTGHPAPGAQYTVSVAGGIPTCVDELVRQVDGSPLSDPMSSIQVTLVSGPAGTQWSQTVCNDDAGLPPTSPCDVTNPVIHVNLFHGTTVTMYSIPTPVAQFVIGDTELHGIGANVNFWGSQWWKNNQMSGFVANGVAGFKGYADLSDNACGGHWASLPGNSSVPPATIGNDIAVIVTSTVQKAGPNISGNIQQILLVHQDGGYGPNPGHAGNGTVTSVICTAE